MPKFLEVTDVAAANVALKSSVANVAALKSAPVATELRLRTLGYHTAGDGGGGAYRWVAGDTATDNGGSVIAHNTAAGR